jgi:hypothetical protein
VEVFAAAAEEPRERGRELQNGFSVVTRRKPEHSESKPIMSYKISSLPELAARLETDPDLEAKLKSDPKGTLATIAAPLQTDVLIYRIVVSALSATVIIALLGAIVITLTPGPTPRTIPDVLVALGSAAVGALAGLLAPSPAKN